MLNKIIVEQTKDYLLLKIPRRMLKKSVLRVSDKASKPQELTEEEVLHLVAQGNKGFSQNKLKPVSSLKELCNVPW